MVKLKKEKSFWKVTYEVGNDWGEDFYTDVVTFTNKESAMEFVDSVILDYYERIIEIKEVAKYVVK